ncbi:MAG: hypothetical protein ABI405_09795 [Parafilimonas sp.]
MLTQLNPHVKFLQLELIYNFQQVNDCVLVNFPGKKSSDSILFYKEEERWDAESELQKKHPVIYSAIQNEIVNTLKVDGYFDQILLQNFLS